MEQNDALRYAAALEAGTYADKVEKAAAAELRRLSAIEADRDALRAEVERLKVDDCSHREAFSSIYRALRPADPDRTTWPAEIGRLRAAPAPVAQRDALRDAAMYEAGQSDALTCHLPPHGWRCTRTAGHDGPCAAVACPEDIELVARGMDRLRDTPAAPAPVAQPLTDEQINDEAWRVEAVEEYEQYTGSPRLKVEGLHDFAHAIAAKLHASATPAPVAQDDDMQQCKKTLAACPPESPLHALSQKALAALDKLDAPDHEAWRAKLWELIDAYRKGHDWPLAMRDRIKAHIAKMPAAPAPVLTPAQAHADELLWSLKGAANYIDKLGGVSQSYRALVNMVEATG